MLKQRRSRHSFSRRGFTLIELLVVVAIIAILASIAAINFLHARERALRAAGAANLHAIAVALQAYTVDYNTLPPADTTAGPFSSSGPEFTSTRNGPAAGGSWDGVPWILIDLHYITDWEILFCPAYLKEYRGGKTLENDWPRYHNFRYAYNTAGLARGGHASGEIMSGTTWLVRDLWIDAAGGFYAGYAPNYPADYRYPWSDGELEMAMYTDFAPRLVRGGTDDPAD
jgi:prepilin-type N-terminal cleavage/methylation domain-containing protein